MKVEVEIIDGVAWAPCPSWRGYMASSEGKLMSPLGQILKGRVNNLGYVKVGKVRNGIESKAQSVHRMVADAWLGKCPEGLEVDHKDHDKANNRPENLQYVTHSENIQRAVEAGRFSDRTGCNSPMFGKRPSLETRQKMRDAKMGERHPKAKRVDVERIMALRATGLTDTQIAAQMGLGRTTVGGVLRGTHWSVRKEYHDKVWPEGTEPTA